MWIRGQCNFCNKITGDKSFVCDPCYENIVLKQNKEYEKNSRPWCKETVNLPDYGACSKARLSEMDRRVILNHNPKEGTYDLGRRGENGKVQEKQPDYR